VHPVWRRLLEDLPFDDGPAEREPGAGRARALEEAAEKDQADPVTQVVVPVEIGLLEMLDDEFAVEKQGAQEAASECRVATRGRFGEKIETPDPTDGAERDVHYAGPVHAVRQRVGGDPVCCFSDEFRRVPLVSGQPVCLAQVCEMLASAELPRNLDVGRSIELVVVN